MNVKFGFYLEILNGPQMNLQLYNPAEQFAAAEILEWIEVVDGKPRKGNPLRKSVAKTDPIATIKTDKATADWPLEFLLPNVEGGKIVSLGYEEGQTWYYGGTEKTPYGTLLLPELGTIEVDDAALTEAPDKPKGGIIAATPAGRNLAREHAVDLATVHATGPGGEVTHEDVVRIAEGERHGRISIPALGLAEENHITQETLREAFPGARIEKRHVEALLRQRQPTAKSQPQGVIFLTPGGEWKEKAHRLEVGSGTTVAHAEVMYSLRKLREYKTMYFDDLFEPAFKAPFRLWTPVALAVARVLARDFEALLHDASSFKGHALLNGYWHIDKEERDLDPFDRKNEKVALYPSVNLGIAYDPIRAPVVNLEKQTIDGQGLRILTLHDADKLSTRDFFAGLHDLIARAGADAALGDGRIRNTTFREWMGYTFIFNNIGTPQMRHERGGSLLPRGRLEGISGMLNMGIIHDDGEVTLQIFFDHRMRDGAPTTQFLDAVYEELMERILPELHQACVWREA